MPTPKTPKLPPIEDARRYIANAKELLSEKARKEDGFYRDEKYVKMAGHTAYAGVLVALDAVLPKKGKGRKSVDWYLENLANMDGKLLDSFNAAYDTLHLSMGYDGNSDAEVVAAGLKRANYIIDWVETRVAA
jgi:hypothetical protein